MITVDASEFEKKGTHSVGVARQYCGRLGKTENCQSGVFAGYTSEHGHCLVDCQLYMPEQWFKEDYKKLWEKNLVPEDVEFQTKPEIALQLIHRVKDIFPASWIGCDSAFGSDDKFLNSLPEGFWHFADVKGSEKVFLDEPEVGVPAYQGKGKPPTKQRVLSGDLRKVSDIAKSDDISWQTVNLGEGAKGPLLARVACMRVYPSRNGFPKDEPVWLFIRKHFDGQTRYAFSNAPADTSFEELCKASAMRWPIEQCFEEGKSHLGMDAYEHRSWPAWHRHMIYVMLAQQFLFRLRQRFKKKLQT